MALQTTGNVLGDAVTLLLSAAASEQAAVEAACTSKLPADMLLPTAATPTTIAAATTAPTVPTATTATFAFSATAPSFVMPRLDGVPLHTPHTPHPPPPPQLEPPAGPASTLELTFLQSIFPSASLVSLAAVLAQEGGSVSEAVSKLTALPAASATDAAPIQLNPHAAPPPSYPVAAAATADGNAANTRVLREIFPSFSDLELQSALASTHGNVGAAVDALCSSGSDAKVLHGSQARAASGARSAPLPSSEGENDGDGDRDASRSADVDGNCDFDVAFAMQLQLELDDTAEAARAARNEHREAQSKADEKMARELSSGRMAARAKTPLSNQESARGH